MYIYHLWPRRQVEGQKVRFGFQNFRHSLASALVKMKVDPKTVQEFLRQAHLTTTLQLYARSDMESKRDAQGRFLEQLLGTEFISSRSEFSDYLGWKIFGEIVEVFWNDGGQGRNRSDYTHGKQASY
jgi:hypothetical protein